MNISNLIEFLTPIQKVRYQSLTKTRRYVYEGKVVTRRTSKVIVSGMENVEQEEREMRYANTSPLYILTDSIVY